MSSKNREIKNKINLEYYYRHKDRICELQKERSKEYYKNNKERKLEIQKEWRKNNPEKSLWHQVKARCKRSGLDFNIEVSDIILPEVCPVFGFKLQIGPENKDNSPSIDRINNSLGYVKGNIQIISMLANRMKTNATKEQLTQFANWILQ